MKSKLRELTKDELIFLAEVLIDRVVQVEGRVNQLENQSSRNSSLPPSRDKQKVKKKTRSLRKKSKRKSGGQKGHKGTTLEFSDTVHDVENYPVEQCAHCLKDLTGLEGQLLERKQVWDIPPVEIQVTEHRRWEVCCPDCQQMTCSYFPDALARGPAVRYGEGIKNHICYLNGSSRQGEFHPKPLTESYVTVSRHTALRSTVRERPRASEQIDSETSGTAVEAIW